MKLFLTSTGLENRSISHHFKMNFLPENASFLVVAIKDPKQDAFYLEKTLNEIRETGAQDIDVFELGSEKFNAKKDYNIVFVCGGNTFDYLNRIRRAKVDKFLINFSKKENTTYVGVSAGSILAGPNIEVAKLCKEQNNMNLQNLKGLHLTDYIIFPHYKKELKADLDAFKRQTEFPVIELEDDQAFVSDGAIFYYINKDLYPVIIQHKALTEKGLSAIIISIIKYN